jgi:hypothetical protein
MFVHCAAKTRFNTDYHCKKHGTDIDKGMCVTVEKHTLGSIKSYTQIAPRGKLSGVSYSETVVTLVTQALYKILL